jgi:hypothetical protein
MNTGLKYIYVTVIFITKKEETAGERGELCNGQIHHLNFLTTIIMLIKVRVTCAVNRPIFHTEQ